MTAAFLLWLGAFQLGAAGPAAPQTIDLFTAGAGGYHTYRIPALLVTRKGTVLAFCEGRKNSARDDGEIALLVRRGVKGGKQWAPTAVVHREGGPEPVTIGNPAPVQDRKTGTIHLLFTRNNRRLFATRSQDDGKTWAEPVEISAALQGIAFAWTRLGAGPGHAIQLRGGRLLVPVWLNDRIKGNYRSAAVYSDDGGATWKPGGIVAPSVPNANECMLFERSNGAVVVNMRSTERQRYSATSRDGGVTWAEPVALPALPGPPCQASILALPERGRASRVVFANSAGEGTRRANLTLRLSEDDGATFTAARSLYAGPSGYSDLAPGKGGTVLCLFESGEQRYTERLRFARVPLSWLRARP